MYYNRYLSLSPDTHKTNEANERDNLVSARSAERKSIAQRNATRFHARENRRRRHRGRKKRASIVVDRSYRSRGNRDKASPINTERGGGGIEKIRKFAPKSIVDSKSSES